MNNLIVNNIKGFNNYQIHRDNYNSKDEVFENTKYDS